MEQQKSILGAIAQRKAVAEWNLRPEKVVAVIQEEAATLMVLTLRHPHMTCLRSQKTGGKRGPLMEDRQDHQEGHDLKARIH
jgi:hypothetical protein